MEHSERLDLLIIEQGERCNGIGRYIGNVSAAVFMASLGAFVGLLSTR